MSVHARSPHRGRRLGAKNLLGQPIYLASKGKGDNSMSEKRLNRNVCTAKCRKSCAYGQAGFAELKSPTVKVVHPSQHT